MVAVFSKMFPRDNKGDIEALSRDIQVMSVQQRCEAQEASQGDVKVTLMTLKEEHSIKNPSRGIEQFFEREAISRYLQ